MPNRRRQRHCFAPGCDTGYKWAQGEQPSLFAVPKDEGKRKVWERNLHRKDKVLDESCSVCERHFDPSCILRDYVHIIEGKEVRIPRGSQSCCRMPYLRSYQTRRAIYRRRRRRLGRQESGRALRCVLLIPRGLVLNKTVTMTL